MALAAAAMAVVDMASGAATTRLRTATAAVEDITTGASGDAAMRLPPSAAAVTTTGAAGILARHLLAAVVAAGRANGGARLPTAAVAAGADITASGEEERLRLLSAKAAVGAGAVSGMATKRRLTANTASTGVSGVVEKQLPPATEEEGGIEIGLRCIANKLLSPAATGLMGLLEKISHAAVASAAAQVSSGMTTVLDLVDEVEVAAAKAFVPMVVAAPHPPSHPR